MILLNISFEKYNELLFKYKWTGYEIGGILGRNYNNIITSVKFDKNIINTKAAIYKPNINYLSEIIKIWRVGNIEFAGFFHTHMKGQENLSIGDELYIKSLVNRNKEYVGELHFPIVILNENIYPYTALINKGEYTIVKEELNII